MRLHNGVYRLKPVAALLVAVVLLAFSPFLPVKALTLSQAKNQQTALEQQQKDNARLLEELKGNRQKKGEYAQAVDRQIDLLQKQMNLVLKDLAALDKALSAEAQMLAQAPQGEKAAHRQNLEALEKAKSQMSGQKSDLEAKSLKLGELYAEAEELLKAAGESQQEAEERAKRLEREQKETEKAIDSWYQQYRQKLEEAGINTANLGGDVYLGTGHFQWPMPGYTGITQYFGSGHRGIDIAGQAIYGKSIVAADQGTVAYAGWMGSYGYVVFVDHGNGYQTRYAHMSALGSQAGDAVEAGQIIGYAGSTGNSTGPHLHFEILYDGALLNPFDYF